MKTYQSIVSTKSLLWSLFVVIFFISCDDEGDDVAPEPFQAIFEISTESIGPGGESLTMDASASTGTNENTIYIWTVQGSSGRFYDSQNNEVSLSNSGSSQELRTTEPIIEFTSVKSGSFFVRLDLLNNNINGGGATSSFSVEGSVTLTEVPDGFEFEDINLDPSIPDYIFDGDVEIGTAFASPDQTGNTPLVFQVSAGAQVSISGDLNLRSAFLTIESAEGSTWKGLVIKEGGTITESSGRSNITLINAAGSSIDNYEPAALVVETETAPSIALQTTNCPGYNVIISSNVTSFLYGSQNALLNTSFNEGLGIYAPIGLWRSLSGTFSKLTLEVDINNQQTGGNINLQGDVLILGSGATFSSKMTLGGEGALIVEEDAALIFAGGLEATSLEFRAVDDAPWRGVYIGGNASAIYECTFRNAGSDLITSSAISATEQAAVYINGGFNGFSNNTILGSSGYGLAVSPIFQLSNSSKNAYGQNTFENTSMAAVRLPQNYGPMFSGNDNAFNVDDGVAAVEVFQTSSGTVYSDWTWDSLGESNYYHFTDNLNITSGNMTVAAGAHFKFNVAKGFVFSTSNGTLRFQGNSEASVVMEAAETSWGGLFVGGTSRFIADYLTIDSGGDVLFTGATEMANLVVSSNLGGAPNGNQLSIFNCTFSNSTAGWGAVLDIQNSFSIDLEDAAFGNSFEGNQLGSFLDKNL